HCKAGNLIKLLGAGGPWGNRGGARPAWITASPPLNRLDRAPCKLDIQSCYRHHRWFAREGIKDDFAFDAISVVRFGLDELGCKRIVVAQPLQKAAACEKA